MIGREAWRRRFLEDDAVTADPQSRGECENRGAMNRDKLHCELCGATDIHPRFDLAAFDVLKCRQCNLVFLSTPLDRPQIEAMYAGEYYQRRHDYYFQNPVFDAAVENTGTHIKNFHYGLSLIEDYAPAGRLLDVGCAIGIFLSLARERGWEVHGVDISKYAVSYCRETLGHHAVAGDLSEARFPDQWFDVITLWDVIEHFAHPCQQLKEVHRVLKNDGIILMDTPNENSLLRWMAAMIYRTSRGIISYPVRKLYHEFHLYYFTPETLQMLLQKCGFELVHLEKKCIPLLKARGHALERMLVKAVSFPERMLNREYELLAVAKKMV
jgi:2-polyprenyl-3-methyl-5-hydroxy-6-metoxy-1,4-benzoquinol methylase